LRHIGNTLALNNSTILLDTKLSLVMYLLYGLVFPQISNILGPY